MGAADLQQPGAQFGAGRERLDRRHDEGALGGTVTYREGGKFVIVRRPAEFFVPLPPGAALSLGHHRSGLDRVALLGLPGPDLVHVEVDVDAISGNRNEGAADSKC